MARAVGPRLAAMMALHYFSLGAWIVTLTTYLLAPPGVGLHFTPVQVGWVYSTLAFGGLVSPLFVGILADRLFAAERVMAALSFVSAGLLAAAGWWCQANGGPVAAAFQTAGEAAGQAAVGRAFGPLFGLMLGYSLCLLINSTLANVLAMRNLHDPGRMFGGVRLWGTVGWMAAGFAVGPLMQPPSHAPLYLAAAAAFLQGLYAFTLPHTPPKGRASPLLEVVGLPALTLFRRFSFCVFVVCLFVVTVMQQWYGVFAPPFLNDLNIRPAATWMTIAQAVEVCSLLLIPVLSDRIGLKGVMLLGLCAWVVRNAAFSFGGWWVVVLVGLPLHGASYTFFTIVGSLYIDRLAPPHLRAGRRG